MLLSSIPLLTLAGKTLSSESSSDSVETLQATLLDDSECMEVTDSSVASRCPLASIALDCCSATIRHASFLICFANTFAQDGDLPKWAASALSVLKYLSHVLSGHTKSTFPGFGLVHPLLFATGSGVCFCFFIGVIAKNVTFGRKEPMFFVVLWGLCQNY